MIVVDASAMTASLTDVGSRGDRARRELSADGHWAAPGHLVVETFSAVRGLWLGGKISDLRARQALTSLESAEVELIPTTRLLRRMWELRANLSGYDAAYIAVAEAFGCSFVTADARLGRAAGVRCEIRLVS